MFTPLVDSAGTFKLKAPFDKLVTPNSVYTCRSIRSINDYLALGDNVFEKFYEPFNIDLEIYQDDLKNNVKIASLQAGIGEWIYVPCSFISEAPSINGVKYVSLILGVALGAIPDSMNLESIIEQFKEITANTLGIESEVKAVLADEPSLISHEDHVRLEAIRTSKITSSGSDKFIIQQLQREGESKDKKIAELEKYIKSKL